MRLLLSFIFCCFHFFVAANIASAHSVQTAKNGKVLLILEESPVAVGDMFSLVDAGGVEKAQVRVAQVKGQRAVAVVTKGDVVAPFTAYQVKALGAEAAATGGASVGSGGAAKMVALKVPQAKGYLVGLAQSQMKVSLTSATTVNMSGTSFNLEAFYERAMTSRVQVLVRGGYDGLKASGSVNSGACGGSNTCTVDIGYLSTDATVKYSFYRGHNSWWVGGGLGFIFPLIKSSNVLDTSKMSLNEKILVGGGLNWYRTPKNFIPVQIEYALHPSNSVVSTNQFILRAGYGLAF